MNRFKSNALIVLCCVFFLLSCGNNNEITVELSVSDSTLLTDSSLVDMIFTVELVDNSEGPYVFPTSCVVSGVLQDPGCGFDPSDPEFRLDLSLIPADAMIRLVIRGRIDSATDLFNGTSSDFTNSAGESITITINRI